MTREKIEEMEILALEAMGLYDVDDMYGQLWKEIREIKKTDKALFQDCTKTSEESYLLYHYVMWACRGENSSLKNDTSV